MKILIGSDIVPTEQSEPLFIDGDIEKLFGGVCELIKNADRTVVNLECALTTAENGIKKFGPCLKASPKCADTLKKLGVTDVALANNHVFDFGVKGLNDTVENLERVGLPYMGIGENDTLSRKPYVIEQDGKKIGFINVCEHEYSYALPDRMGANPFNPFLTMRDIRTLKKNVDFVVALYHGGKEHCRYPSPRLRALCQEMVACGADVVIAQHSHCIGCYENYEGGHIVYGQGNFHFCKENKFLAATWYTSLLLELNVTDRVDIRFIPIVTGKNGIDIADEEAAQAIMASFFQRNEELKNGQWKDGWHAFCVSMQDFYKSILQGLSIPETPSDKTELFSHYLDCEAHTDVWRELFPTWNMTNEK